MIMLNWPKTNLINAIWRQVYSNMQPHKPLKWGMV